MGGSVLILTGPPGSGKSTIADLLASNSAGPSAHLHTDDFYDRYIKAGYVPPWLPEALAQNATVINAIVAATFAYADGGYFVVVDGIVGPWFLDPYRKAAQVHAIALSYVVLRAKADTSVRRVIERATHGLKAEAVVRDLHRQFSDLGALEAHAIDTTDIDAAAAAEIVAKGLETGRFRLP